MSVRAIAALWCVAPCFAFEFPVLYQFRHDCGPAGCLPPTTLKATTQTSIVTGCDGKCFETTTTTPVITHTATKTTTTLPSTGTITGTVTGTTQTGSTFSGTTVTATTVTASTSHTTTTTISKTTSSVTSSSTSSTSSTTTTATATGSATTVTRTPTTTTVLITTTTKSSTTVTTVTSTTTTHFVSTCTTTQPCVILIKCDEKDDIADGKLTEADKTNCGTKVYVIGKDSPTIRHPMNPCKPNGDCWDPDTCCPDCLPQGICSSIKAKDSDRCKVTEIGTPWDCRRVTWNYLTTILQPAGQLMWVKKDGDANLAEDDQGNKYKGNCQPWCKFLVHDLACTREINHCSACSFCVDRTPGQGPETFQCQPDCTGAGFNPENCLPGAQRYMECRGCAQCKTHKPCPCFRLVICDCGLYLVTHRDKFKYPLLYNPVNESNPLQGFKCPACLDRQGVCHNVTFGSEEFCGENTKKGGHATGQFFECPGHPPALLTSFEDDLWGEGCADNDVNLHFEEPWCGDVGRGFGKKTPASSVIKDVSNPHECQKKCLAVPSCGNFTWTAGDEGSSGTCSLYSAFTATKGLNDYTFDKSMVSGPKTCGDHRKMVESMKYDGAKPILVPEPDEPTIVEAKFATKVDGSHSNDNIFLTGYIAAGMGVAGLFVLAAYTLYRRAHREYSGMPEVLENGLSEVSATE